MTALQIRESSKNQKKVKSEREIYFYKTLKSPIGPITVVAKDSKLVSLGWDMPLENSKNKTFIKAKSEEQALFREVETQLKEYFVGQRKRFDLPLSLEGTEFQKKVWKELSKIPYGSVISYGEQARRMGKPKAVRAVGGANGKNPLAIIVPCHRVIGTSGMLTGFAGGLNVKKKLLELEGLKVQGQGPSSRCF